MAEISVHAHRFGGREFRFGNAEVGTGTRAALLIYRFPVQFAMLSCRKALPRGTPGFQTRAGSRFTSEAMNTSTTRFGFCGCPIFDMP